MRTTNLRISSPKRSRSTHRGWQGFFPYYAGFPLAFAEQVIASANLSKGSLVFDPWNGSGTTTFAASEAGHRACGFDLNPVMVVVARARNLAATEADALQPIASKVIASVLTHAEQLDPRDPLLEWFQLETALAIRGLEQEIRALLVGPFTQALGGPDLGMISGIAATCYVAVFSSVRALVRGLRTTNPTWIKKPSSLEERLNPGTRLVFDGFYHALTEMADTLIGDARALPLQHGRAHTTIIKNYDSSAVGLDPESVDLILTSPPYCTRLDYAQLTRAELAVLAPLLTYSYPDIKKQLLGSVVAPQTIPEPQSAWGHTCLTFLEQVVNHKSKASSTYYYRTHVDYFDKLFRSINNASQALRSGGCAVFVLQDSFYKDVQNPLQQIATEMMAHCGLQVTRREDFPVRTIMASRHQHASTYRAHSRATESVLCAEKY